MKYLSIFVSTALCIAVLVLGIANAQDDKPAEIPAEETPPTFETVRSVLPYLHSSVPEHRLKAERILTENADAHFEALLGEMGELPRAGRVALLRILTATDHAGRVKLCVDTLCDRQARRDERIIASRALRKVEAASLLGLIEKRLADEELPEYQRIQSAALLGTLTNARAQGVAEELLNAATPGTLFAFAAEDALLRSILAAPFAQPAWGRYQERHPETPKVTLKELQAAMDDLALPRATDRALAEVRLAEMIGEDTRVMLALARSPWLERAAFALKQLEGGQHGELDLAVQAVMLDVVTTGEQTVALMAMDVAIAGAPPSETEMDGLRPAISGDSATRLEAILEGMSRDDDLADLRQRDKKLKAELRPLLLRRSAFDPEVRALLRELGGLKSRLELLEEQWEGGWRREFEQEILGIRKN